MGGSTISCYEFLISYEICIVIEGNARQLKADTCDECPTNSIENCLISSFLFALTLSYVCHIIIIQKVRQ